MNVKEATLEQLKSAAYDQLVILEQTQLNLRILNEEIKSRNEPKVEPKVE